MVVESQRDRKPINGPCSLCAATALTKELAKIPLPSISPILILSQLWIVRFTSGPRQSRSTGEEFVEIVSIIVTP